MAALARRDNAEGTLAAFTARLAEVESQLAEVGAYDPISAIAERLQLDATTALLLSAATAFAGDPRIPPHAEALGGPLARRGLSVAVFSELAEISPEAGQELVSALALDHVLYDYGLLGYADDLATPAARPYVVPSRVLAHVLGNDVCPSGIVEVAPDARWLYDDAHEDTLRELERALSAKEHPLVVLEGRVGSGRRSAVAHVTQRPVLVLDAEGLAPDALRSGLRSLQRETFLRGATAVLADPPAGAEALVARFNGALVITTTRPDLELGTHRLTVRMRWEQPDVALRRQLWLEYASRSGTTPEGDVDLLATRYRVGPGAIVHAVGSASALARDRLSVDDLVTGLRHNIGERMTGLAQRVPIMQRWDDVVLADDIRDQVQALVARVRHSHTVLDQWGYRSKIARGAGVAALFSGPPGTGKTMVAGLIARELDLELYQVDLSQVVSKWVGETEKQLSRVFDGAEEGHALLLFDEADALFGQRTADVKGATDRYANLEVNYLLQRIEAFGGITVLTTNLDANIDRAVKRRLAAHIVFAMPDEEERAVLWRRLAQTATAPLDTAIDYDELARAFPMMSGANIRNAAFSAAYIAAAAGAKQITQDHFTRAGRAEYRSMGHVLAERSMGRSQLR
jgi:hypothetical protein